METDRKLYNNWKDTIPDQPVNSDSEVHPVFKKIFDGFEVKPEWYETIDPDKNPDFFSGEELVGVLDEDDEIYHLTIKNLPNGINTVTLKSYDEIENLWIALEASLEALDKRKAREERLQDERDEQEAEEADGIRYRTDGDTGERIK